MHIHTNRKNAKRKSIRKILVIGLAAVLMIGVLGGCNKGKQATSEKPSEASSSKPAQTEKTSEKKTEERTEKAILEDLIIYYASYGSEADDKIDELLTELSDKDSAKGELWTKIMDYWKYANDELVVNENRLPDDLPQDDSLCIVVLGFQLNADGSMQDELIGRLKVAAACAEQYPNAIVLCTGGGTASENPDATEAGQMAEWLINYGIDKDRVIIEDTAHTTAENAMNSYTILRTDYPQVDSVALVSSSYHIGWGSLLFETGFLQAAAEQNAPEIHVISNAAYPFVNDVYTEGIIIRCEAGGMLQLIGSEDTAIKLYRQDMFFQKPPLD